MDLSLCIPWASYTGISKPCVYHGLRFEMSRTNVSQANILVDVHCTPRLVDFGLTTILYNSPTAATSLTGGVSGTLQWMAPELLDSAYTDDDPLKGRLSPASDVYALAITIWQVRLSLT
jgi:serine/threonine protein kinase